MNMGIRDERIAKGQCPDCGEEAAPYRLCSSCRLKLRINRQMKRGRAHGVLQFMGGETRLTKDTLIWKGPKFDDPEATAAWGKWSPSIYPRENDGRAAPRLNKTRVDVEETLVRVMEYIGRPCTIEEINAAWGRLRAKRTSPLPADLARIIVAQDRRQRKMAKRAAVIARQEMTE